MKRSRKRDFDELTDLPNVGRAVAGDLRRLGIQSPEQITGRDPYEMYDELNRITGKRHDPCMLDTFIAVVRFMGGEAAKPWWAYTAERKRHLAGQTSAGSHKRSRPVRQK